MASRAIKSAPLVTLPELQRSFEFFKGASLRVIGKSVNHGCSRIHTKLRVVIRLAVTEEMQNSIDWLQEYFVGTAVAVIADQSANLFIGGNLSFLASSLSSLVNSIFNPTMRQSCQNVLVGMFMALSSISIISLCS